MDTQRAIKPSFTVGDTGTVLLQTNGDRVWTLQLDGPMPQHYAVEAIADLIKTIEARPEIKFKLDSPPTLVGQSSL